MEQTFSVPIRGTGDNENSAGLSYRKVNPEGVKAVCGHCCGPTSFMLYTQSRSLASTLHELVVDCCSCMLDTTSDSRPEEVDAIYTNHRFDLMMLWDSFGSDCTDPARSCDGWFVPHVHDKSCNDAFTCNDDGGAGSKGGRVDAGVILDLIDGCGSVCP